MRNVNIGYCQSLNYVAAMLLVALQFQVILDATRLRRQLRLPVAVRTLVLTLPRAELGREGPRLARPGGSTIN